MAGSEGGSTAADDGFETRAIHAGQPPDAITRAVVPAISLSTTFAQDAPGAARGHAYSRASNPTRAALEECVASLEGGAHARAFASGMAASDAVLRALLQPGDHVVLPTDVYGGTYRLVSRVLASTGITWTTADLTDAESVGDSMGPTTRVVWVESPTNPLLTVLDIRAIAEVARQRGVRVVVDNTFATPYLQRPLALGADAVVHSSTKYLGGHSDVVGGIVVTGDADLAGRLAFFQSAIGAVPSPFDCYLVLRGIKTLAVRMDRHCENARAVVSALADHPGVARVLYPGLPTHPGYDVARRQMHDFGGMVSFLAAGGEVAAHAIASGTRLFTLAESLGGVESLVGCPARMSHATLAGTELEAHPALVRLSVGIETAADLVSDLLQSLDRASEAT